MLGRLAQPNWACAPHITAFLVRCWLTSACCPVVHFSCFALAGRRHTVAKAREKATQLAPDLHTILLGGDNILASASQELLGTAAILSMATNQKRTPVLVRTVRTRDLLEVYIAVPGRRTGRPKAKTSATVAKPVGGSDSWSLALEDRGVFAYGVRRKLLEEGWSCRPWDDTGKGFCHRDWRSLVDNMRPKEGRTVKLARSTTNTWDSRAQKRPSSKDADIQWQMQT